MSTLDNLKKSARRWLKALRADDADPHARLSRADPKAPARPNLRDVQHALAREHGHESWIDLRRALDDGKGVSATPDVDQYDAMARDVLAAYKDGDPAACTVYRNDSMSMPANRAHQQMLELLIRFGARVPDVAKWGRAYYFKHDDIAAFLLERGMNPNHMNWQRTTLLHDMAWEGDVRKAGLLLDDGADINAVDDEYRSTPLGVAARCGRADVVKLLLDRGADPKRSSASWSTPVAWAQKKGHSDIAAVLRSAGA